MLHEGASKASPIRIGKHEKAKSSIDQKKFLVKKGQDNKPIGGAGKKEKSPESSPKHV